MNSPPNTRPVLMIGMLVIAIFFSMGSRVIFSPLMPFLQKEMGFNLSTAGSLFLLISIIYGIAMLCSGFLSARVGHGNTIAAALAAITLGLVLAAFARNILVLAAGMLFIGAGAGTYPPSGIAMINTKINRELRHTAFAFHEIGPNLAFLFSPLLVLAFEPWLGWRGVLLGLGGICGLAAAAFLRWGAPGAGTGAAPDLHTIRTILRLRSTLLGMAILSSGTAALQGVYAIIPAYLVTEYSFSSRHVNILLILSRITGIFLLLRISAIMARFGRRRTITGILFFSAFFTALIGLVKGPLISIVVVLQPALLAGLFPPVLSSIAEIGELRYQNLTYAVIITAGVSLGGGAAPALLGLFSDWGIGWVGFAAIAVSMVLAVLFLFSTPAFGRDRDAPAVEGPLP